MAFQPENVNAAEPPLVYTQNNAPAPTGKAFSPASFADFQNQNTLYMSADGRLQFINSDTGEVTREGEKPDARFERWALKAAVNKLLPKSRTAKCHRARRPFSSATVYRTVQEGRAKAFYSGLQVCANVWCCPICAAKISERRREELKIAIDRAKEQGLNVCMLTLTAPHYAGQNLTELLDKMQAAYIKLWRDKAGKRLIQRFGLVGRIRAFEVTYGDNGFHPHFHVLLFYPNSVRVEPAEMEDAVFPVWLNACTKKGLPAPSRKHGVKVDLGYGAVETYIAKWGLESEMTKGHIKRSKTGYSMTDLLREYLATGDKEFARIWLIYARAFKGRRQLVWTNGLKARLLVEEKTDEQLAEEQVEEADLFAELTVEEWRSVLYTRSEAALLHVAEKYPQDFWVFMSSILQTYLQAEEAAARQRTRPTRQRLAAADDVPKDVWILPERKNWKPFWA